MSQQAQQAKDMLVQYFTDMCDMHPEINPNMLDDYGRIWYANGLNGTDYDWAVNNCTCKFYIFYKESQKGYIQAWITREGLIEGYMYPDEGRGEPVELPKRHMDARMVAEFVEVLYREADPPTHMYVPLDTLSFSEDVTAHVLSFLSERDFPL